MPLADLGSISQTAIVFLHYKSERPFVLTRNGTGCNVMAQVVQSCDVTGSVLVHRIRGGLQVIGHRSNGPVKYGVAFFPSRGPLAQLAEHRTFNPGVQGSNP